MIKVIKLRKSPLEKSNEELGKAKLAGQKRLYKEAASFAEKALDYLGTSGDRRKSDLIKAHYYEYLGLQAVKENKALEATNYFGRSGGFYQRLNMLSEQERVFTQQANILRVLARNLMAEKKFVDSASYFEQAAMAYQKLNMKFDELDCKAKSYVSRAAAEKSISGRKLYLKKAVELIDEKGTDEPVIKGHLAYYNALFNEDDLPQIALKYYAEALQYYQLAGVESRVTEIQHKMNELTYK